MIDPISKLAARLDNSLDFVLEYPPLAEVLLDSLQSMYNDSGGNDWVATFKPDCWAPGLWAGCEGMEFIMRWSEDGPGFIMYEVEKWTIKGVDLEKKRMYLTIENIS